MWLVARLGIEYVLGLVKHSLCMHQVKQLLNATPSHFLSWCIRTELRRSAGDVAGGAAGDRVCAGPGEAAAARGPIAALLQRRVQGLVRRPRARLARPGALQPGGMMMMMMMMMMMW
jgi:hypothetical protein